MVASNTLPVLRIAHAFGNRRHRIQQALDEGIDFIEADVRYHRGRIWVRHELKLPFLPVLFNGSVEPFHRQGPWRVYLRYLFARLDVAPIPFEELLDTVGDRAGLLLDLKADRYSQPTAVRFIDQLLQMLGTWFTGPIGFCGNWDLLDLVAARRPTQLVHYSVDREIGWERMQRRIRSGAAVRGITIKERMLDERRAALLRSSDVEYYCWDVATAEQATRAIGLGAAGIISHHFDVFTSMRSSIEEAP